MNAVDRNAATLIRHGKERQRERLSVELDGDPIAVANEQDDLMLIGETIADGRVRGGEEVGAEMIEPAAECSGDDHERAGDGLSNTLERELSIGEILVDGVTFERDVERVSPSNGRTPRGIEIADEQFGDQIGLAACVDAMIDAPNAIDGRGAIDQPSGFGRSSANDEQHLLIDRRRRKF